MQKHVLGTLVIHNPTYQNKVQPEGMEEKLNDHFKTLHKFIDDLEELLTNNRILRQRTEDNGVIAKQEAIEWGRTGPDLRSDGID